MPTRPLPTTPTATVLKGLDTSGDGSISRAEFSMFLNKLDTNLDASLSASEIHKAGVGLIGVLGLMGPHHGGSAAGHPRLTALLIRAPRAGAV